MVTQTSKNKTPKTQKPKMSLWHIDPPPLQGNKRAKARGQRGWSWGEEMSNVSGVLQEEGVGASLHLSPCERSFKGTSWGACPQESEMHQGLVSDQSERLQLWAGSLQSQCKLWATWGHSPCSGGGGRLNSSPHAAHHPMGLVLELIPSSLESFPILPQRTGQSGECIPCSLTIRGK